VAIQLLGLALGLAAIHLTYIYYRRAQFTKRELVFWLLLWLGFIFIALFPKSVSPLTGYLGLTRIMDLIMIAAFVILFALVFHNYIINRQQQKKLEKLVRELALRDLDKN